MAQPPISRGDALAALAAVEQHGTITAAAQALGMPRGTFENRVRRARQMDLTAPAIEPATIREPLSSFEEAWTQWQRAIGMAKDRYSPPVRQRAKIDPGRSKKILVVPDLHAPFHEPEMFAEMLDRERDADMVVCIGDLSDSYALSTFIKYERMPFTDEWAQVTLAMQELATRFPRVIVVIGNHDGRFEKRIRERLTEDMVDAVRFMTGGLLCPITALAKRYPNVEVARHVTPSGASVDWFTTVGDAWFGHPEKYSRVAGAALRFTEEWIADNEVALGMDRYRLIAMGHTHAAAILPYRADKLLVECGCLCQQQGYMLSPRIGGRPQRRGYVTFTQDDGVTDLNSVRFRWLDVA
jgi:predicted phosphodiesterase